MKGHTLSRYFLAYTAWIVVLLAGVWLALLSRNALLGVFTAVYVQGLAPRARQVLSLEKFFTLGMGLAWLGLMIVSEFSFRAGVQKGHLFKRFARILGIELLLIFLADGALFWVQGFHAATWLRWLALGGELAGAVLCLVLANRKLQIANYKSEIGDER